ncbi:MAG TPA: hypothetical protein VN426_11935 [Syntrophomonadaceae bacterium]|nr:hypothetical protein [Syntrophomonadaceae bacterium]
MDDDLRNCPVCGRVFSYTGLLTVCTVCQNTEDAIYARIRQCIVEHPGANLLDVARETGIDGAIILRFIREGRLRT